jgi:hypothetical protein
MANLQQERALAANGDALAGSNVGKGQMQAADFVMTPNVQFAANSTGGVGGAISDYGGKLFGGLGRIAGGLAGGMKFKEAQTSLLIADVRSGIQVAAEEGVATKTDFGISGWSWGGGDYTRLGGYTNTPEGKMVAASLLDNYNRIVVKIPQRAEPGARQQRGQQGQCAGVDAGRYAGIGRGQRVRPPGDGQGLHGTARLQQADGDAEALGRGDRHRRGARWLRPDRRRERLRRLGAAHAGGDAGGAALIQGVPWRLL